MSTYETIPLLFIVICLYGITYILYKENIIKRHSQIWDIIILFCCIIFLINSLLTTIFVEYNINTPLSDIIDFWHVELGIILVPIGIIHIYTHRKNFKKIF
jgi:cytochrome bd-type quinol oxidase subunit 2